MPDPATMMMGAQLLGGFLGRRSRPNFQQTLQRNQSLMQQQLAFAVQNLNQFGGQLSQGYQQASPMFGQLAQGASQMYADDNRRQQLAQDMAKFTRGNQAARGTFRSPAAGLKESFAGLQFQEQMRQQDFGCGAGFSGSTNLWNDDRKHSWRSRLPRDGGKKTGRSSKQGFDDEHDHGNG